MTAAMDTDRLQGKAGLHAEQALRQAATFLADLVERGTSDPPWEFDDFEESDGWVRRFDEAWVGSVLRSAQPWEALWTRSERGNPTTGRGLVVLVGRKAPGFATTTKTVTP